MQRSFTLNSILAGVLHIADPDLFERTLQRVGLHQALGSLVHESSEQLGSLVELIMIRGGMYSPVYDSRQKVCRLERKLCLLCQLLRSTYMMVN